MPFRRLRLAAALPGVLGALAGCTEIGGRKTIQEGNELYKNGRYEEAVAKFAEAEAKVPHLPVLWLNKGYTCRQLLIPGSKTAENRKAADCALAAFKKMQELAPKDPRGEQLYIQTLFDAEDFEVLAKMFLDRHQKNPSDLDNISTLQQVYAKWDKFDEALEWYKKSAEVRAENPEAQYSVGVFIWQRLFSKGGGAPMNMFDPRPQPRQPLPVPPPNAYGDVVSQQRVDMADLGIKYLEKAVEMRPKYTEAMTYLNLLYRQKAFAFFGEPDVWLENINKANEWQKKTLEILNAGKHPAPSPSPAGATPAMTGSPAPSAVPSPSPAQKTAAVPSKPGAH